MQGDLLSQLYCLCWPHKCNIEQFALYSFNQTKVSWLITSDFLRGLKFRYNHSFHFFYRHLFWFGSSSHHLFLFSVVQHSDIFIVRVSDLIFWLCSRFFMSKLWFHGQLTKCLISWVTPSLPLQKNTVFILSLLRHQRLRPTSTFSQSAGPLVLEWWQLSIHSMENRLPRLEA